MRLRLKRKNTKKNINNKGQPKLWLRGRSLLKQMFRGHRNKGSGAISLWGNKQQRQRSWQSRGRSRGRENKRTGHFGGNTHAKLDMDARQFRNHNCNVCFNGWKLQNKRSAGSPEEHTNNVYIYIYNSLKTLFSWENHPLNFKILLLTTRSTF